MRPKLLEIEGLQSFRDVQRIDFESLGETGLFGIFGPTGSGKSTVLDAITFALYGKVKRADGGTQGIININLNQAKVAFTFELIKNGQKKNFRVERLYQRKKNSANSCEPKIVRLIEITEAGEIPVCDKATEVSSSIRELLGLSHEDFTRAVVLPQNSFQEFLLLNNSERRGMLERIFYLEEYGKQLQEKLNRKMGRFKSRLDVLAGELKGYAEATDEALEEAQKEYKLAAAERNRMEKEWKLLEVRFQEAKEVWSLIEELSGIEQREQQHLAFSEVISEERARLEKALKADGLLEIIRNSRELTGKLRETEKQLEEVFVRLPGVEAGLGEIRQKYEKITKEAASEEPKLVGFRTRLGDALGLRKEIFDIRSKIDDLRIPALRLKEEIGNKNEAIKEETAEFQTWEQKQSRLKQEMESLQADPEYRQQIQEGGKLESAVETLRGKAIELENKAEALKNTVAGLELKLEGIRKEIVLSQKALEDLSGEKQKHAAALPEDKNAVQKYREKTHSLQSVYEVLKLRKNELEEVNVRIKKLESAGEGLTQKTAALEKEKEKIGIFSEQCRLALKDVCRQMEKNTVWVLSRGLKEGEPCPVCGSEHHPRPVTHGDGIELPVLEKQVEDARKKQAEAEKAFQEAEKAALIAGEQRKALADQLAQTRKELELKNGELTKEKHKLPPELAKLELEQVYLELEKRKGISADKLKAVAAWESKQEEYQEELFKLKETVAGYRLKENGILTECKLNRENLEEMEKALAEAKNVLREKEQKNAEFLQKYRIKSVAAELLRLAENDRQIQGLQKQLAQAQELITARRNNLEQWKEQLQALNDDWIKTEAEIGNWNGQMAERIKKVRELAGEEDIEDQIKRIDKRLQEYAKSKKQYEEGLRSLEKEYTDLETSKALLANQQSIYGQSLEKEKGRLKTALKEKDFTDLGEVESSLLSAQNQKALKDEIQEYDQNGANIQSQKKMVQRKLNSRTLTEEEWNLIRNSYQELTVYKEECVSRSEVARNNLERLKEKHIHWVELSRSYLENSRKQGLYEQIQKLLRAEHRKDNSFIDFIAEERLRYVAAKASEILGVMTKHKYALELDVDAGFIVRDNGNGGVHRMVTSLSGGETFLTSLSLALALSEQIQLKGQSPLEFFFLDEGFGTLDPNLLDSVIDSLERLSRKERVIGIISHVPELRSRIARRLIVEPPTSQGDGSMVRVEKA